MAKNTGGFDTSVTNGHYGNGMFNVVRAEDVPQAIRRTGRSGKWAQAVDLLNGMEVGTGLSLVVPKNDVPSARGGITSAVNRLGAGLQVQTRTAPVAGDEENITLYIIKQAAGENDTFEPESANEPEDASN